MKKKATREPRTAREVTSLAKKAASVNLLAPPSIPKSTGNNNSVPIFFENEISFLNNNVPEGLRGRLNTLSGAIRSQNTIRCLVEILQNRAQLQEITDQLPLALRPRARSAQNADDDDIVKIFNIVLSSEQQKNQILDLDGHDARKFIAALRKYADLTRYSRGSRISRECRAFIPHLESISTLPRSLTMEGLGFPHRGDSCSGTYADVFHWEHDGEELAVKRMRSVSTREKRIIFQQALCRLCLLWQGLNHPRILPFLGIDAEHYPQIPCLISPWMQRGTILKYIETVGPQNVSVERLMLEVAEGMVYLHAQNIIHGNLKGSNVLIDEGGHILLADAGLIDIVDGIPSSTTVTLIGSTRWMPPELISGTETDLRSTRASDVYSFACLCLEVYTGHHPFYDLPNAATVIQMVASGTRPSRPDYGSRMRIPDDMWSIIESCWKHRPSERPNFTDVVSDLKRGDFSS